MSETVRAVIFDFGGVFIDSPFAALADAANERGLPPEALALAVFGAYDTDTDHPWHRLERGELSLLEAREAIMADSSLPGGILLDPFELLGSLAGGGVREEMIEFCVELRQEGLLTGLLTNNAKEFEEFWRPMVPLEAMFTDVVDSSAVGMRKPDPGIYRLAMDRLGVTPGETVFVDDAPGNVSAAEALGIRSVLIGHDRSSVAPAISEIRSHLELTPR